MVFASSICGHRPSTANAVLHVPTGSIPYPVIGASASLCMSLAPVSCLLETWQISSVSGCPRFARALGGLCGTPHPGAVFLSFHGLRLPFFFRSGRGHDADAPSSTDLLLSTTMKHQRPLPSPTTTSTCTPTTAPTRLRPTARCFSHHKLG
jgi:hypothetical protein